jgi:hypothetical protein
MPELSRYLFLAGALPFLVLGVVHAMVTPLAVTELKGLSPSDAELPIAMARSRLRITKRTDMWLSWVGFNLSHSLGIIAFGTFVIVIGMNSVSFAQHEAAAVPLSLLVSALYLCLAAKYWFRTPIIGCALSVGCFITSWAVMILAGS